MKHLVLVVTIGIMSITAKATEFCVVITPEFPQAYEAAHAVFIGEVVSISKPLSSDSDASLVDRLHKVTFKVDYSWKGAGFREFGLSELVVLSDQGRAGDCGAWGSLSEGRKYLVFANQSVENNLIRGNRTALLSNASGDIKELRRLDAFFQFRAKHKSP